MVNAPLKRWGDYGSIPYVGTMGRFIILGIFTGALVIICLYCEYILYKDYLKLNKTTVPFAERNHPLKKILNPILTKFGWIIVSVFDDDTLEYKGLQFKAYPKHCKNPEWKVWIKIRFKERNK